MTFEELPILYPEPASLPGIFCAVSDFDEETLNALPLSIAVIVGISSYGRYISENNMSWKLARPLTQQELKERGLND